MKDLKIIIENGSFKKIPEYLKSLSSTFTIITDFNLKELGIELKNRMKKRKLPCNLLILPAGEKTKSLAITEKTIKSLITFGTKRDSCLIALGGGVIGDLVGFVASIFMRGIKFVSVPTTLLSMCDSSIGGKTGIDLDEGKNLLGTFYDPALIIMDPLLLKMLPEREMRNGLAEIIKHGVIANKKLFELLERKNTAINSKNSQLLKKIIQENVKTKMSIVKKDKKESLENPIRMLLNYGHTVGHALEKLSDFTIPHGEAIAIGMVAENRLAIGKNLLKEKDSKRIEALLKLYRLPTKIPSEYSPASIQKAIKMDKKNIENKLYFALPIRIGKARVIPVKL